MTDKRISSWMACGCGDLLTETDARNVARFNAWMLAWAVSLLAATYALARDLVPAGPLAWVIALVPTALALVAFVSYGRFLRQADEMLRVIHLEAGLFAFGAGILFALGWWMLELAGAPATDLTWVALVMFMAWGIGQWRAVRRYR